MEKLDFIVGCGYTGLQLAERRIMHGYNVHALSRTLDHCQLLQDKKIRVTRGDLDHDKPLVFPDINIENLFYLVPPNPAVAGDRRVAKLLTALNHVSPPNRIVYISTTGVYGDAKGAWVDEKSEINPLSRNAKNRVVAELAFKEWCQFNAVNLTILRVAGIYGSERLPVKRIKQGLKVVKKSESAVSNRIHVFDLVSICERVTATDEVFDIVNVADGNPSTMTDYFVKVAKMYDLPQPEEITMNQAMQEFSSEMISYLKESKKVSNKKLREKLGYCLRYPNLESGLSAS